MYPPTRAPKMLVNPPAILVAKIETMINAEVVEVYLGAAR